MVTFEEAKKRAFEEASGTCATYAPMDSSGGFGAGGGALGTGDMPAHIIPFLVWNEINLYPPRRKVFMKAFLQTDILVGVAGTKIYVPIFGRDIFTARSATEATIDTSGFTRDKPTPTEVEICIGDVIYNATRVSDILREDSPTLGWVRALLQGMGIALDYKQEQDAEGILFTGGVAGGNVVGAVAAGVLSFNDIVNVKAEMSKKSFYPMGQPFYLFINPDEEADLIKEMAGVTAGGEGVELAGGAWMKPTIGQPIEAMIPLIAGCEPNVTEVMREGFALVVIPPTHPYGPAAIWATKRPLKAETYRDFYFGGDVWLLSTRYGFATKRNEMIGLVSNC